MKLNLVLAPNNVLLKPCLPVNKITDKHRILIIQMFELMKKHNGVGLSAPQVGRLLRILVMDTTHAKDGVRKAMINPEIINLSDVLQTNIEGCLSFPGIFKNTERPEEVTVKYLDVQGNEYTETLKGLSAQCFLHEFDHLNGIVFHDLR